jgi:transposase
LAVSGIFVYEDQRQINGRSRANQEQTQEQNQIKSFPAEAGPTVLAVFAVFAWDRL